MGELAALLAAFLWSGTSTLLAGLVVRVPAPVLSFARLTVAIPMYVVLLLATGTWEEIADASWQTIVSMLGSGMLGFGIGDSLYIVGLGRVGIAKTFPVSMALFTLLTFLGAGLLLDEDIGWNVAGGAALILAGCYFIVVGGRSERAPRPEPVTVSEAPVLAGGAPTDVSRRRLALVSLPAYTGWVAVVVSAAFWAAATLWLTAGSGDLGALAAGSLRVPAGAFALGVFVGSVYGFRSLEVFKDRRRLTAVIAAGWLGSAIGGALYIYSVQEAGAAKAAILSATSPLLALPLAFMFLGERPTRRVLAGTLITVAGVVLVVA
jgi:drug/metabolite transporter (DMT)-like permease